MKIVFLKDFRYNTSYMHLYRPSSYSRGCDPCSHGEERLSFFNPDQTSKFCSAAAAAAAKTAVLPTACSTYYAQPGAAATRTSACSSTSQCLQGPTQWPRPSFSEQCDAATLLHDEPASNDESGRGEFCDGGRSDLALNYQL